MELRHLRYFIAVAEESTLVAAAKRLRIAQPALTRQIHDLEREIGVDLFDRTARGVELTAAGDVCLASARHILQQVEVAIDRARGSSMGVVGRCRICVGVRALSSGVIALVADRVHAEYPDIELVVSEGIGSRQWRAIQLGEVDIGIGIAASSEFRELASETLDYDVCDAVLISNGDELATRKSISLTELTDRTFLSWSAKDYPEISAQQKVAFARLGFKPARKREFGDVSAITAMVGAGQGWALFPSSLMALAIAGATVVPLEDLRIPLQIGVVSRRDETRAVVRTVIGIIRRVMNAERVAAGRGPASGSDLEVEPVAVEDDIDDVSSRERGIELRHLRYYRAVVEAKSFGRAAERLELTQPALSRQIRDLEQSVGVSLLARTARGVNATAAGESFFRSTRRVLDEADALPAEAHRARRGMVSRCVVAAVGTMSARALLSGLLRRFAAEQPQIEIFIEDYLTPMQPAALRAAQVDVGLCHAIPMSPVEERGLRRDHLVDDVVNCALVPAGSELAQRSSIEFADLAEIPFIFPDRAFQPLLYDQVFSIFESHAFIPRVEKTFEGLKTIWTMVADGRGWALGFQSQCADPPAGTVCVPVNGFAMPWGLDVLSRDDESRTPILLLIDMLIEIARSSNEQRTVA